MLRVVGLALWLMVGIAVRGEAADEHAGEAVASTAHWGATTRAAMAPVQQPTPALQLTRASTGAQWSPWGTWSALRRRVVTPTAGLAAFPPESRARNGSLALPWVNQGKSGLRLPVTERLSFAVGYRHLEPEDLSRRYAEAGSVDYDSHDFLLRAHWRF